jgi:hypothetical protein
LRWVGSIGVVCKQVPPLKIDWDFRFQEKPL